MKLFSKKDLGDKKEYDILGIKFYKNKKLPSELSLNEQIKKLKSIFKNKVGYELNLDNPQTLI